MAVFSFVLEAVRSFYLRPCVSYNSFSFEVFDRLAELRQCLASREKWIQRCAISVLQSTSSAPIAKCEDKARRLVQRVQVRIVWREHNVVVHLRYRSELKVWDGHVTAVA